MQSDLHILFLVLIVGSLQVLDTSRSGVDYLEMRNFLIA